MEDEKSILVLYKSKGKFYNTVGFDSYLMNYIFGYKVLKDDRCGFPDNAIGSVLSKLDSLMISYQIVYSDRNPLIKDFKNRNNYSEYAECARNNSIIRKRIESIINYLDSLGPDKVDLILSKIEKIIK